MSVAFVGAGRMGLPMVRRLSAAGESVRVLARSDSTREAVGGIARAVAVSTVTEAVDGVEAVIVCVHKDSEVREICLDAGLVDGMPDGSVLIVHTTGSPDTAKDLARVAERRGSGSSTRRSAADPMTSPAVRSRSSSAGTTPRCPRLVDSSAPTANH